MEKAIDNLFYNRNEIPESGEKLLMQLIHNLTSMSTSASCTSITLHFIDLKRTFENMRVHLACEHSGLQTEELMRALKNRDLAASLLEAQCLLQKIRTLDLSNLLSLNKENDAILERLRNRDVYLLLETDNATLYNMVSGKLKAKPDESNQIKTDDMSLKLANIAQLNVNIHRDLPQLCKELTFCQLPGLFNSKEPEVQIASFLAVQKIVKICSGINAFFVLKSDLSVEQWEHFFHSFFNLLQCSESIENFSFISFSHFKIGRIFLDPLISATVDEHRASFFKKLADKVFNQTIFIKDLESLSLETILYKIKKYHFYKYPSRIFTFKLCEERANMVQKQVEQHLKQIESGLNKNDLVYCEFKVNELFEVVSLFVDNERIHETVAAFEPQILSLMKPKHNESAPILRKLNENSLINEKDVKKLIELRKSSQETERILRILFKSVRISAELTKILDETLKLSTQKERICEKLSSNKNQLEHLKTLLDNLQVLKRVDELKDLNVASKYDQVCRVMQHEIQKMFDASKNQMRSFDSKSIADELDKFDTLDRLFSGHLNELDRTYSNRLENLLKQNLEQTQRTTLKLLKADLLLSKNDLDKLDETDSQLSRILSNHRLVKRVQFEELNAIYIGFIQSLRNYSFLIENDMKQELALFNLSSVKLLFEQLHSIKTKNANFVNALHDNYSRCLLLMSNFLNAHKEKIITQIKSVFADQNSSFDHFELRKSLNLFMELAWLDTFKTNMFTIAKRQIEESLGYHLDEAIESLFELKIDEKNSQNIPQASCLLSQINKKSQLFTHFEHFKTKTNQIDEFLEKLNANLRLSYSRIFLSKKDANNNLDNPFFLAKIQKQMKNHIETDPSLICTRIDYEAVERCLTYLQACESIKMCAKNEIEHQLVDMLVQRQSALIELLQRCFELICTSEDEPRSIEAIDEAILLINRHRPELELIKEKLSPKFTCLKKETLSEWAIRFKSRIYELENEMDNLTRLGANYKLVKALIRLNTCWLMNGKDDLNCLTLAMKYSSHIKALNTNLNEKASQLIQRHCYEELAIELDKHTDELFENTISTAKFKLNNALREMLSRTLLRVHYLYELDMNELKALQEGVERIRMAKQHLVKYVDSTLVHNLDTHEEQILNQLKTHVNKYKASIQDAIESWDILKAEEKLIHLRKSIFYFDLLDMKINDEWGIEHSFEEMIEHRFDRLEIDRFWLESPRHIYEQLLKSKLTDSALRMKFLQTILEKYERAHSMTGNPLSKMLSWVSTRRGRKRQLDCTKRSILYLPEDLRNKVEESVLRDLRERIGEEEEEDGEFDDQHTHQSTSHLFAKRMKSIYHEHIASQPMQVLIPILLVSFFVLRFLFAIFF